VLAGTARRATGLCRACFALCVDARDLCGQSLHRCRSSSGKTTLLTRSLLSVRVSEQPSKLFKLGRELGGADENRGDKFPSTVSIVEF
jgi:hypothetical protein